MAEVHIFTDGPIGTDYPEMIAAQLARVGNATKIIHHLSSPGGNVYAGYNAFHKLIALGIPIDTIVEGEAQSMGSFIMLASRKTGGSIKVLNPSRIMIHNPKFNTESFGQNGFADSDQLQGGADELRKIEAEMAEVYAEAMSKKKPTTVDQVKALMKKETYMTAREAVQLGLADEIINFIDTTQHQKLKAVALGIKLNDTMEKNDLTIAGKIGDMFEKLGQTLKGTAVKAAVGVELPIAGGGVLVVEGDVAAVDAVATIDGAPAEGTYALEDGSSVTCVAGKVTAITPAAVAKPPVPAVPALDPAKLAQENEALKAQLAAIQLAANADKEVITAKEVEVAKVAEAITKLEVELNTIKSKTVGSDEKPDKGMNPNPVSIGGRTTPEMKSIYASRSFLADNMPHLERRYKNGKYSDGTSFFDYRHGGPCAVSILETNFSYTWQGELTTDLFFKPTLGSPSLTEIFTVDTGSKDKKRYNIVPVLNKILKPYTGCAQATTGTALDITDKYIQLKAFRMKEEWCKDDFTGQLTGVFNHLAQEWIKDGNEAFDPAGTPIDRIIMDSLKDSLRRDVFRRVMLGDSDSTSADWNQINGLVTTLIDQSGASNYCVYREGTALGIGSLSANTASDRFTDMYKNSNILFKDYGIDTGKAKFIVTRSVWDNYYATLVGVGAVTEQAYADYKQGLKTLEFRGIPVVPYGILDSFLADSAAPLFTTVRHLAILTMPENNILGVENTSDLGAIKSWFSDDDNKRYYTSQMTFGVLAPIHCDLTTIAY